MWREPPRVRQRYADRLDRELHYRIDAWAPDGNRIERLMAAIDDIFVARTAFEKIVELYPEQRWTLRQRARIIAEHPERAIG
jgi:hypothetical protein